MIRFNKAIRRTWFGPKQCFLMVPGNGFQNHLQSWVREAYPPRRFILRNSLYRALAACTLPSLRSLCTYSNVETSRSLGDFNVRSDVP